MPARTSPHILANGPAGDEARLYAQLAPRLRQLVAHRVTTAAVNVEDACSFAWVALLRCQPHRETVFAWLARVAIREAWRLDRAQRTGHEQTVEPAGLEGVCVAAAGVDVRLELAEALTELGSIHPRRRAMLVAHASGGTFAEIAAAHGVSAARARELVYRARLQLRERTGRVGVASRSRR